MGEVHYNWELVLRILQSVVLVAEEGGEGLGLEGNLMVLALYSEEREHLHARVCQRPRGVEEPGTLKVVVLEGARLVLAEKELGWETKACCLKEQEKYRSWLFFYLVAGVEVALSPRIQRRFQWSVG